MKRAVLRVMVLAMVWAGANRALPAQDSAGGAKPTPMRMAKDADPDWAVVTVKPSDPNDKNSGNGFTGSRYKIERKTAVQMLAIGYGMHRKQIANAPDWAATDGWDVIGVPDVPGEPSDEQGNGLVRKLLAERFGLKVHHEQRELPVYVLVLAKSGPKLTASTHDPNEVPDISGSGNGTQVTFRYTNNSMADFANELQDWSDRPIVDKTGLKGRYDFNLKWAPDETHVATTADAPPVLFAAIQEELGLKLEPAKAMVDALVIDQIEKPGAN